MLLNPICAECERPIDLEKKKWKIKLIKGRKKLFHKKCSIKGKEKSK